MKERALRIGAVPKEHLDEIFSAKTSSTEEFLRHIEDTYGGAEAYF